MLQTPTLMTWRRMRFSCPPCALTQSLAGVSARSFGTAPPPIEGEGREGKEREEKGRREKLREGKGREGKGKAVYSVKPKPKHEKKMYTLIIRMK